MRNEEYHRHLGKHLLPYEKDPVRYEELKNYEREIFIMANLNPDPAEEILLSLYSPHEVGKERRDPLCMMRAMILMLLCAVKGVTRWVGKTRKEEILAVLAGFTPGNTPGVGTYYDFMRRIINGPWRKPCGHNVRRSDSVTKRHVRDIPAEKEAKKEKQDPRCSQSEKLAGELLAGSGKPRMNDFLKALEDLLILVGVIPSVEAGLITALENLTISGDGSILGTAASPHGKKVCDCAENGIRKCDHPRSYTSPTAEWCYDASHDRYIFGDRYYHLVTAQNGHDFPLLVLMPGGNESDYTLSLKACDRFLKAAAENGLNVRIYAFCGDGHHDSYAHYKYFAEKDIIPIIPLSENTEKAFPKLSGRENVRFDEKGKPLCPGGVPMRHHSFNRRKNTHVFTCPAKRNTHRDGKSVYVMHTEDCPEGKDCAPDSTIAPIIYVKSDSDQRLFPPIPRDSKKFKELAKQRSASERMNAVIDCYNIDGAHRNADYSLIRLTFAYIAHHAVIRYLEAAKNSRPGELLAEILARIRAGPPAECCDAA